MNLVKADEHFYLTSLNIPDMDNIQKQKWLHY